MRTMFLRVNKNKPNLRPNQTPLMNLDAHAWRCDGTTDALLGGDCPKYHTIDNPKHYAGPGTGLPQHPVI